MEKEDLGRNHDMTLHHHILQYDTIIIDFEFEVASCHILQNSAVKHQTSKILYVRCGSASGLTGEPGTEKLDK